MENGRGGFILRCPARRRSLGWRSGLFVVVCSSMFLVGTNHNRTALADSQAAKVVQEAVHQAALRRWSKLFDAISADSPQQLQKLASEGISLTAPMTAEEGDTPLYLAAVQARPRAAAYLVAHGADINARDKHNLSPLDGAVWSGSQPIIKLLLAKGATVDVCAAAALGRAGQVARMVAADPKLLNYRAEGDQPLIWAARAGQTAVVKALLDAGAGVNAPDDLGETALVAAVRAKSLPTVTLLLKKGADPKLADRSAGYNALDQADSVEMIDLLLAHGANVNGRDYFGKSALQRQVLRERLDLMAHLIQRGANLNAQDDEGNTPLHEAAQWGELKEAQLLVKDGASLDIKNKDGLTPLQLARKWGNSEFGNPGNYVVADFLQKAAAHAPRPAAADVPPGRLVSARQLIGTYVRNSKGANGKGAVLGTLSDVVLTPDGNTVLYALVTWRYGGLLGAMSGSNLEYSVVP